VSFDLEDLELWEPEIGLSVDVCPVGTCVLTCAPLSCITVTDPCRTTCVATGVEPVA
jgi:hypothetical protein